MLGFSITIARGNYSFPLIIRLKEPMRKNLHTSRFPQVLIPFVLSSFGLVFFSTFLLAKNFVKPVAQPAKTYAAHDEHPTEKLAIAADPYDTPDKASIFSVEFREHGFLPVFFVVTNDGDQPVSIANMEIKLVTAGRAKLTPSSPEDIYRRLSIRRRTRIRHCLSPFRIRR